MSTKVDFISRTLACRKVYKVKTQKPWIMPSEFTLPKAVAHGEGPEATLCFGSFAGASGFNKNSHFNMTF
jgi:hypothetical protein